MKIYLCTKGGSVLINQCGEEYLCAISELPKEAEIMFCYDHIEPCQVLWKSWLNYGARIEATDSKKLRKMGGLFAAAADMAETLNRGTP